MINKKAILCIIVTTFFLDISGCISADAPDNQYNKFVGTWSNEQMTITFNNDRSVKWIDNRTYLYSLPYKSCFPPCDISYQLKIYALNNESDMLLLDYEFSLDDKILILNDSIHLYKK